MRHKFDSKKSDLLRHNPKRSIGFEEVQQIWDHPYYLDRRNNDPEQFRAIGWVDDILYSVIYEEREDQEGDYLWLVTLWKSTSQERRLYERERH